MHATIMAVVANFQKINSPGANRLARVDHDLAELHDAWEELLEVGEQQRTARDLLPKLALLLIPRIRHRQPEPERDEQHARRDG